MLNGIYAEGNPDFLEIMKGDKCIRWCEYLNDDALPFVIGNGQLYIGGRGCGHSSCRYPENIKEDGDFAFGRIWFCDDSHQMFPYYVISFWDETAERTIDISLVDKLLDKYGIDKKDVVVASFEEDDCGKIYPYSEWSGKISKANEKQKQARVIHLMNAQDKQKATSGFRSARDSKIGKKLTNDKGIEMPVAKYRSLIYAENKQYQPISKMKRKIRLTESDLHRMVKRSLSKVLREGWNDDRYEYDHLSDVGNGGLEEYGMNIAQIIYGLGGDSDSLHALGEQTAQELLQMREGSGDNQFGKQNAEKYLKPFIEGLIAVYKNPKSPYDVYGKFGIERN